MLDRLVAKQVLGRDDDPRSPERGQYVFLQALLRTVAYGTLSRRARKAQHVAAARHLEQTWPGELRDIAEVLASHYQEAIRADPDADDVAALRAAARETLTAAGRAAASLALGPEARAVLRAGRRARRGRPRARRAVRAGRTRAAGQRRYRPRAEQALRRAIDLFQQRAADRRVGDGGAGRGDAPRRTPRRGPGAARAFRRRRGSRRRRDRAGRGPGTARAGLGRSRARSIPQARCSRRRSTRSNADQTWSALADALVSRAVYLVYSYRREEGLGVLRHALALADAHGLSGIALRARHNLAAVALETDQFGGALDELREALRLARERGDRVWERQLLGQMLAPLVVLGRWEEAAPQAEALFAGVQDVDATVANTHLATIAAARGDDSSLQPVCRWPPRPASRAYVDQRMCSTVVLARGALDRSEHEEALRLAAEVFRAESTASELIEEAFAIGTEAAMGLPDEVAISELDSPRRGAATCPRPTADASRRGSARCRAGAPRRRLHGRRRTRAGRDRHPAQRRRAAAPRPCAARARPPA